ncbi:C-C motif chemokine 20-like [Leptodactylus fuscus]
MTHVSSLGVLCILLLGSQSLIYAAVFDCCYRYTRKPLPLRAVNRYIVQNSHEVCDIDAIILITKKFRVCANPTDKWVKKIITQLKKKQKMIEQTKKNATQDTGI